MDFLKHLNGIDDNTFSPVEVNTYRTLSKLSEFGILSRPHFNFLGGFAGKAVRQILIGSFAQYYLKKARPSLEASSPFHYLEVGSWLGASLLTVVEAIEGTRAEKKFTCVDFWQPYASHDDVKASEKANQMESLLVAEMALPIFLHNAASSVDPRNLYIKRKISSEALSEMDDSSIDLIFVDGSHYFDHVVSDIRRSYELLKPGGILLLDDYECRFTDVACWEDINEQDFVTNPATSVMFHPGVSRAVNAFCEEKSVPEQNVGQIGGLGIIFKKGELEKEYDINLDIFVASHLPPAWLNLSIEDFKNQVNGSGYSFNEDTMTLKFKQREI